MLKLLKAYAQPKNKGGAGATKNATGDDKNAGGRNPMATVNRNLRPTRGPVITGSRFN